MAIAKELSMNSWILETNLEEKLGIISFNSENDSYVLISSDTKINFESFSELEGLLGEPVNVKNKETVQAQFKDIDGYPIQHEVVENIERDGKLIVYESKRKGKKYYAGYWCIPNGINNLTNWYSRISLSVDVYNQYLDIGIMPKGPYKEKVEALFGVKQGEKE